MSSIPATDHVIATISGGNTVDVNRAVAAARSAFPSYSQTSVQERLALLERILAEYEARLDEIAEVTSREMGAPIKLPVNGRSGSVGTTSGVPIRALSDFQFEFQEGDMILRREPIGGVWHDHALELAYEQVAVKVVPALAAGCTNGVEAE